MNPRAFSALVAYTAYKRSCAANGEPVLSLWDWLGQARPGRPAERVQMTNVEFVAYYSLQDVGGSFGVLPSPINSRDERDAALAETKRRVELTWGNLKIILLVVDEHIDDAAIHQWLNWLKLAHTRLAHREFQPSRYAEDAAGNDITEYDDE